LKVGPSNSHIFSSTRRSASSNFLGDLFRAGYH
jgi:hypothetical protein